MRAQQRLDLAPPLLAVGERLVLTLAREVAGRLVRRSRFPPTPLTRCVQGSISTIRPIVRSRKARSCETTASPPSKPARKRSSRSSPSKSRSFVGSSSRSRSKRERRIAASAGSRRLAAGQGRRRLLERDVEPELGADGAGSMLEVAATEREEALERRAVRVGLPRLRVPLDGGLRLGDPGPALEVGAERLRGTPVVLLRQVADRERRRASARRGPRPAPRAPASSRSSVDLPAPFRPTRPSRERGPSVRSTRSRTRLAPYALDDAGERDSHGRYLLTGTRTSAWLEARRTSMCSFSPSWEGAGAPRASYNRSRRLSSADQRGSPATSSCVCGSTFRSLPQIGQRPAQSGSWRI